MRLPSGTRPSRNQKVIYSELSVSVWMHLGRDRNKLIEILKPVYGPEKAATVGGIIHEGHTEQEARRDARAKPKTAPARAKPTPERGR